MQFMGQKMYGPVVGTNYCNDACLAVDSGPTEGTDYAIMKVMAVDFGPIEGTDFVIMTVLAVYYGTTIVEGDYYWNVVQASSGNA